MTRFTMDNTEGYTDEQLDELNRMFDAQISEDEEGPHWAEMSDMQQKSYKDYIAESLLARYDTECIEMRKVAGYP